MARLFVALFLVYAATLGLLFAKGMHPAIPWAFIPGLLLIIPWGLGLADGLFWLEKRLAHVSPLKMGAGGVLLALAFVYFADWTQFWPLAALVFVYAIWRLFAEPGALLKPLEVALVVLFLGYGTVWNFNYLGIKACADRLCDADLLNFDVALYGWLNVIDAGAEGMFPLVRQPVFNRLLEHAYLLYFVETFAVLFVLLRLGRKLTPFLGAIFLSFALAVPVFLLVPAIGPSLAFPDTVDPAWRSSGVNSLMGRILAEFHAVMKGDELNGFGYFFALPSMHVAIAVVLQAFLYPSRVHFWFFLPINVLLCSATFLLGCHYFLDFPFGVALGMAGVGLTGLAQRWLARPSAEPVLATA